MILGLDELSYFFFNKSVYAMLLLLVLSVLENDKKENKSDKHDEIIEQLHRYVGHMSDLVKQPSSVQLDPESKEINRSLYLHLICSLKNIPLAEVPLLMMKLSDGKSRDNGIVEIVEEDFIVARVLSDKVDIRSLDGTIQFYISFTDVNRGLRVLKKEYVIRVHLYREDGIIRLDVHKSKLRHEDLPHFAEEPLPPWEEYRKRIFYEE
jgi:hypothetical protein